MYNLYIFQNINVKSVLTLLKMSLVLIKKEYQTNYMEEDVVKNFLLKIY